PIFAIAGNHDSFIVPGTKLADEPLKTFARNFCATNLSITREAASLHRTAMTQPGVYFTLDAPFVRIIGLFSNALEDPGVISSHAHNYQRYTRTVDFGAADPFDVPFIVCGDSGHNVNPVVRGSKGQPAHDPGNGIDVSYLERKPAVKSKGLLLEKHDSLNYG